MSDTKSDLLTPLLALVAKWRDAAAVLSRTTDAIKNARAETYQSCADQLQAAIESLAAHRGEVDAEVACNVFGEPFVKWSDGSKTGEHIGAKLCLIPPQAQAGAGDAWLPIESAPKDGTLHVRGLHAHRTDEGLLGWLAFAGRMSDDGMDFIDAEGQFIGWMPDDYTHWQPLPAPPALDGGSNG